MKSVALETIRVSGRTSSTLVCAGFAFTIGTIIKVSVAAWTTVRIGGVIYSECLGSGAGSTKAGRLRACLTFVATFFAK